MRKPLVAGNWKLYGSILKVRQLIQSIKSKTVNLTIEIIICPPTIFIPQVAKLVEGTSLLLGGQNCYVAEQGAFTGEVSPYMLREFGCEYVIVGHSERRLLFGENNQLIMKKFVAACDAGLKPILCIGETNEDREREKTLQVLETQLAPIIARVGVRAFRQAVIAYEPVWAIATGLSATSEQAQAVHMHIRSLLAKADPSVAAQVRILYGGSIKPENATKLFNKPDIDGGLIGAASLNAGDFAVICQQALLPV